MVDIRDDELLLQKRNETLMKPKPVRGQELVCEVHVRTKRGGTQRQNRDDAQMVLVIAAKHKRVHDVTR